MSECPSDARAPFRGGAYADILPGIRIKTLVHGELSLMSKFLIKAGSELPPHSHPYEQDGLPAVGKAQTRHRGRDPRGGTW